MEYSPRLTLALARTLVLSVLWRKRSIGAAMPLLEALVVTLAKTPDGDRVRFDLRVGPDDSIEMDRDDLAEVLGNLLENAARFAAGVV